VWAPSAPEIGLSRFFTADIVVRSGTPLSGGLEVELDWEAAMGLDVELDWGAAAGSEVVLEVCGTMGVLVVVFVAISCTLHAATAAVPTYIAASTRAATAIPSPIQASQRHLPLGSVLLSGSLPT
jgi:hypothetical protein